jgi:HSP20 family protein
LPLLGLRDFTRHFDELRREFDRAFDFEGGREAWPSIDVKDEGKSWVLRAELPGVTEKNIELTANAESLTLKAERALEPLKGYAVHRQERTGFRLARTFTLPTKIDPEKIDATFKNGVLTVTLPKAAEAQPRQVQVRANA